MSDISLISAKIILRQLKKELSNSSNKNKSWADYSRYYKNELADLAEVFREYQDLLTLLESENLD